MGFPHSHKAGGESPIVAQTAMPNKSTTKDENKTKHPHPVPPPLRGGG